MDKLRCFIYVNTRCIIYKQACQFQKKTVLIHKLIKTLFSLLHPFSCPNAKISKASVWQFGKPIYTQSCIVNLKTHNTLKSYQQEHITSLSLTLFFFSTYSNVCISISVQNLKWISSAFSDFIPHIIIRYVCITHVFYRIEKSQQLPSKKKKKIKVQQ